MSHVVLLAGGSPHAHNFDSTGSALAELIVGCGHDVQRFDCPDRAAEALREGPAALVVHGLWWQMLGDAYDQWRGDHGYSPPASTRGAFVDFVRSGGGLLAVHTTLICFDDWSEWGTMLGGAWQWGVSSHPPVGPVAAHIVHDHPVVAGLPPTIRLHDEVYGDVAIDDDVEVLAVARRHPHDSDQPVVWVHRFGAGRVVVDGFGHDEESIRDRDHSRLLTQSLDWVLEEV